MLFDYFSSTIFLKYRAFEMHVSQMSLAGNLDIEKIEYQYFYLHHFANFPKYTPLTII